MRAPWSKGCGALRFSAVILGLDPRIERRGALVLASVVQAENPILGASPRMTMVG
jgi:hypothetical protein